VVGLEDLGLPGVGDEAEVTHQGDRGGTREGGHG
jgi:hypothetical protein